jgi:hypothetical protein
MYQKGITTINKGGGLKAIAQIAQGKRQQPNKSHTSNHQYASARAQPGTRPTRPAQKGKILPDWGKGAQRAVAELETAKKKGEG